MQEYAYWIITSAWDIQETYGLGENEWVLKTSAQLQASLSEDLAWHQAIWVYSMEIFKSFGVPMFIGCLPWMALSAWLGYRYTLKLIVRRRTHRQALKQRRAQHARR